MLEVLSQPVDDVVEADDWLAVLSLEQEPAWGTVSGSRDCEECPGRRRADGADSCEYAMAGLAVLLVLAR
jgi:hypothetical protein